jgi:hypothetical protein
MELDTRYIHLSIQNNILVGAYKKRLKINLEAARQIVKDRICFVDNQKMAAMIITGKLVSMDKPARDYLASAEGTQGLLACAIVVKSHFSSFLGNYFMNVNKTSIPVKIFSDPAKAQIWLQQFIT